MSIFLTGDITGCVVRKDGALFSNANKLEKVENTKTREIKIKREFRKFLLLDFHMYYDITSIIKNN